MAITITFNGVNYFVPAFNDGGYAQGPGNMSAYWIALSTGTLQQAGGNFSLVSDVNFGLNFGLLSKYFTSISSTPATAGVVRLSKTDTIDWRNNANSANLALGINGSDLLTFNGTPISGSGAVSPGTANQLAYYATTSSVVSGLTAITANKALASDVNGLPVASSTTDTELGFVHGVTSAIQTQINAIIAAGQFQTGDIKIAAYTSVPAGWLLCDGSAVNRTTFSALFAVIGTTYGPGDGSTTFNVPNAVNAVPIGAGSIAAMGVTAGTQTHSVTVPELPVHNFTVNVTDPGHNHAVTDPTHVHTQRVNLAGSGSGVGMTPTGPSATFQTTNINTVAASTGVTVNSNTTGITATTNNVGSGTAMSLVQPSLGFTYFIKT